MAHPAPKKAQSAIPLAADNRNMIAILVMNSRAGPVLCPFFAKCDGVLLINEKEHSSQFHGNRRAAAKPLCELVVALKPRALVCGFIGDTEKRKLQRAGIDVRLGACSCSIDQLIAGFDALPEA